MAQMISVVRYDITKNNVTTGLVKSRFSSMMDAQLYIKDDSPFQNSKVSKHTLKSKRG